MRKYTILILFVFCNLCYCHPFCTLALAQPDRQETFNSPPSPVGSGARAIGMGGAFIAVADDATAASWNPAGLTQLKRPELSIVYSHNKRIEDYSSSLQPEAAKSQDTISDDLNYFSIAYPFELFERNMIVSLNYQMMYSFDRDLNFDYINIGKYAKVEQKIDYQQKGNLKTLSPAYCLEITPNFALGATFNIWTDKLFWGNGWERVNTKEKKEISLTDLSVTKSYSRVYESYSSFSGFNMNLGFLWNVNRILTVGAVVKTPFRAGVKYKKIITDKTIQSDGHISEESSDPKKEDRDIYMPPAYGVGMALRFTDKLTVSCDMTRTDWSKFVLEESNGDRYSPITGKPTRESHVHATNQVRLGAEYLFILTNTVVPFRCGLFYDPEPAQNNQNDFWGCSVGTGVSIGKLILDIAYQFRYGRNVDGDDLDVPQTNADVSQHLILASAIYHF